MEARATWIRNLSFTGTANSGFTLPLGAKREVGGDEDGFHPVELIAIGLAGCTGMDVISILKKKGQKVTGFEVIVRGERAENHPRRFTRMDVEYVVTGVDIDPAAVARSVDLSRDKYCAVTATLRPRVEITDRIRIIEEPGERAPAVSQGD
ncbi:MAG TPA: OsmC family protein [Chloroflexi bacterium]|jgi:putative redox protein|nr:OsmC family protein [Chloroflexota bacterium]HPO58505.1 OsmC family protein [Anaerolineaceae bacterium]